VTRKLIRPSLPEAKRAGASASRRGAPETTHAEASYLLRAIDRKAAVVVVLLDGTELRGTLEYHDRDCLKLAREGEPSLLVRTAQVKYYWAE
jgi:hypothetical protein